MITVRIIELEFEVLNVFCNAVYLNFGLVDNRLRIQHAHTIYFTLLHLLSK